MDNTYKIFQSRVVLTLAKIRALPMTKMWLETLRNVKDVEFARLMARYTPTPVKELLDREHTSPRRAPLGVRGLGHGAGIGTPWTKDATHGPEWEGNDGDIEPIRLDCLLVEAVFAGMPGAYCRHTDLQSACVYGPSNEVYTWNGACTHSCLLKTQRCPGKNKQRSKAKEYQNNKITRYMDIRKNGQPPASLAPKRKTKASCLPGPCSAAVAATEKQLKEELEEKLGMNEAGEVGELDLQKRPNLSATGKESPQAKAERLEAQRLYHKAWRTTMSPEDQEKYRERGRVNMQQWRRRNALTNISYIHRVTVLYGRNIILASFSTLKSFLWSLAD
ncbi:uncharacterized protein BO97DRAFT_416378 [Aspergillus homomorphus CBS 101889]|uniref:Uncharacterized protein n=1 Tax=Aspergillus homomorphus (strain CBS 101889) TaxID=1450537 RepID=A0A395HRF4_ASPHC|nr:hypothetical protein BO97DRAFT_416378 [Aspergillus homomorphus CBS 101889]RAL09905.1 hypothetical protein BO97DRAFT_416378 [Aspergillus homomorphus CBS 101889]